ncbi:MAG: SEC-C domain-containing protein [Mesorhizobium sp.]|nr:MAG: SEC-C domain-containing protein [Mesorhizobium sp.]
MFQPRPTRSVQSRNSPCPCGSGKRFKHCHGAFRGLWRAGVNEKEVLELLRRQEAAELLRKRHHGHGRPVISAELNGHRFVAVGKRLMSSRSWSFFTDFLVDNLKEVLGQDWGKDASSRMPDFPIFRWLRRLQDTQREVRSDNRLPSRGFVRAILRLAYALYLIEHNDGPPRTMLKRIRHPNTFDAHCYEALVSAAFALAGAKIKGAEDEAGNSPKPEFFAEFTDGKRYAVEAKRKASWKTPFVRGTAEFEQELRGWLRDKLYAASKKELTDPVYWFELGIGETVTREDIEYLRSLIGSAINEAEEITIKGQPARTAYVVVTNNPEFANDDAISDGFHLLQGFRMDDFREGFIDIETAMEWHDRHRAIRRVLECVEEVQQLPASFAGVPNELLDGQGNPVSVPQIGEQMVYPGPDGKEAVGVIVDILPADDVAWVVISDVAQGNSYIVTTKLTEQEAIAAAKYGPMIFGKPESKPHKNITNPLEFYDRMLDIYADFSRESLLNQVRGHRDFERFNTLSDKELHTRVARELTKVVDFQSKAKIGQ